MADELFPSLGIQDLAAFSNTVQQNDPFGLAGRGLASWQPDMTTWNAPTQGIASFGKAFLSGLMQNYARQNASDQLSKVATVLPSMQSDPYGTAMPEGIDPTAFQALRVGAILNKEQEKSALAQLMQKVGIAGLTKKAEVMGEAQGRQAAYPDLTSDPESPQYKVNKDKVDSLDAVRKEFNALPDVKDFSKVLSAAQATAGAVKDYGKISDQELVRYAIQMIEPGMAVREGEAAAVANSQSLPDAFRAQFISALNGKSTLLPEAREGIKRLAQRAYDSKKENYDKALNYYQGLASGKGMGEGESISFLGQAPEASSIFGQIEPAPSFDSSAVVSELQSIRTRLAEGDVTPTEKLQLLEKARNLASATGSSGATGSW